MAKAPPAPQASTSKAVPTPAPKKRAAASEIDDIFASKKSKVAPVAAAAPAAAPAPDATASKKKKKSKKGKEVATVESEQASATASTAPVKKAPETIVDTSSTIESYRPVAPTVKKRKTGDGEVDSKALEEEENFMDSRGTNRRRTDDGLAIYDIKELKIGLGGDTPECPFDCQCCF